MVEGRGGGTNVHGTGMAGKMLLEEPWSPRLWANTDHSFSLSKEENKSSGHRCLALSLHLICFLTLDRLQPPMQQSRLCLWSVEARWLLDCVSPRAKGRLGSPGVDGSASPSLNPLTAPLKGDVQRTWRAGQAGCCPESHLLPSPSGDGASPATSCSRLSAISQPAGASVREEEAQNSSSHHLDTCLENKYAEGLGDLGLN